jgi:hypothetical protein
MLHFFRSDAYNLDNLKKCWLNIVLDEIEIKEESGYLLAVGDHSKIVKEARYMPGVKKHHQDSDNSGKGEYIFGHEFGMIGFITESQKMQCIPVDIELHNGKDDITELTKRLKEENEASAYIKEVEIVSDEESDCKIKENKKRMKQKNKKKTKKEKK